MLLVGAALGANSVHLIATTEVNVFHGTRRGYTPGVSRWSDRIKEIRVARKLTQEQLADLIIEKGGAMDRYRLSKLESGENENPELATLELIAAALAIDVGELFARPRSEEETERDHERPNEGSPVLEQLLGAIDTETPADDSWKGDVLKAIAVLNRALRRPADKSGIGQSHQ